MSATKVLEGLRAARVIAVSLATTCMAHCATHSGITGLTLPGMMEEPT